MTGSPSPYSGWLRAVAIGLVVLLMAPHLGTAQNLQQQRESTERRLSNLKEQIQRDQSRLEETAEEERTTKKKLKQLEREIALREELVSTYQTRLSQLEEERVRLRDTLNTLEDRLDALQREYRARVVHAYKYNRIPDLALILASRSINQMLVRIRYLQRFAQQRQDQRSDVQKAAERVRASRSKLEQKQEKTEDLLAEARTERENLRALQRDRQQVIEDLRARRSELKAEIQKKQEQAAELEQQIRALIAKVNRRNAGDSEAEQAERAAMVANLSASFESSKGNLPWPAEGAITEEYGNQVDPVHGTTTYHPGILIATNPEEQVRAVFKGTVRGVDFVPGYGTYLVVRHGDYLSVYSNFSTLYVSQGQQVEAGQVLGLAGTKDEPRGAGVFFAVFDQSEPVNPMPWLSAR